MYSVFRNHLPSAQCRNKNQHKTQTLKKKKNRREKKKVNLQATHLVSCNKKNI